MFNEQSWSVHTNNAWVGRPPRTINHLCIYIRFWGLAIYNVNNRNKTELQKNLEYLNANWNIRWFFALFLTLLKLMWLLNFSISSLYYRSYRDNQIIKMAGRKKKKAIIYEWKCYFWGISRKSIIINKIWPMCFQTLCVNSQWFHANNDKLLAIFSSSYFSSYFDSMFFNHIHVSEFN